MFLLLNSSKIFAQIGMGKRGAVSALLQRLVVRNYAESRRRVGPGFPSHSFPVHRRLVRHRRPAATPWIRLDEDRTLHSLVRRFRIEMSVLERDESLVVRKQRLSIGRVACQCFLGHVDVLSRVVCSVFNGLRNIYYYMHILRGHLGPLSRDFASLQEKHRL